ncbi:MAG: DUF4301 family protein [Paludibacter sp.]|nr:DUF4301 family protein [Paludibacter sp.]
MLQPSDYKLLKQKGISEIQVLDQLHTFTTGFPFLKIIGPATPALGIFQCPPESISLYLNLWDDYLMSDKSILKFVPASGAASRMFKDLFEFLDGDSDVPVKKAEVEFFDRLTDFAFYDVLNEMCISNAGKDIPQLLKDKQYKVIVELLLKHNGLNYGSLPKGLLLFHTYKNEKRTPVQEHLTEGALYAMNKQKAVNIHFTVSSEHKSLFEKHVEQIVSACSKKYDATFQLTFSEQKPSTDTIAAEENNEPFRDKGELLFRPGGHGALIENLNDLDADVIFIKNIDNVVPDSLKDDTILYKKVIAGLLVKLQGKAFDYLRDMDEGRLSDETLWQIANFCEHELNNIHPGIAELSGEELQDYLYNKLNRPIRICGMVKNTGEPGGGPFLTVNQDGTISTQILESSQINLSDSVEKEKMMQSTHFNPVDLVCGVKNYKGEKFDLLKYVDKNTGFISLKSKNGKALKALELPGLWNGAMSDWNTVFVEVPISTFNPVKTVNDLLRKEHQ